MKASEHERTSDDSPFAEVVRQRDVSEDAVHDGGSLEGGGGLLNGGNHFEQDERR